jgi:adenine deaminase
MEISMKMLFIFLVLMPFGIAAAIAQQSATSGPGHPELLPESSPVRIKQGATPRSGDICIVHVTVIDTASGKENRDRVVTISGDRIAGVVEGSAMAPAGSCRVIDGTGKYLIPGLWDMHAHGSRSLTGSCHYMSPTA